MEPDEGMAADFRRLTSRGRATRARMKGAAQQALAESRLVDITIAEITGRAGVAVGLFYRYFPDLPSLLSEALEDWVATVFAEEEPADAESDPFVALRSQIKRLVERIDAPPRLFTRLLEGSARAPGAAKAWRQGYDRWLRRRMRDINNAHPGNASGVEQLVAGLGGMIEGFLMQRYFHRSDLAASVAGSAGEIAELTALIWRRAIDLKNPPAGAIERYRALARIGDG